MLSAFEHKVVIDTLAKRRSWLKKTLADTNLDPSLKKEHSDTLSCLDSAIKKLASLKPRKASTPSVSVAIEQQKSAAKPPKTLEELRILIAEDQTEARQILSTILSDMGVKLIDEATDGREAFDKIKAAAKPYHVILCDWEMPELSGIEVHEKAKASNRLGYAKFWMVSGVTESQKIRDAVQQGVDDYVVKPVDPEILESKIKALLEKEDDTE